MLDKISKGMSLAGKERTKDWGLGRIYTLTSGGWRDTKERDSEVLTKDVGETGKCGGLTTVLCAEAKIELNI